MNCLKGYFSLLEQLSAVHTVNYSMHEVSWYSGYMYIVLESGLVRSVHVFTCKAHLSLPIWNSCSFVHVLLGEPTMVMPTYHK